MTRYQMSKRMCDYILVAKERAVRGAELAATGHVHQIADGDQFFVDGRTDAYYVVDVSRGTCNCPDGRAPHSEQGRKLCKHMIAALLS